MAIKPVIKIGNPILSQLSDEIDAAFINEELKQGLIQDMFDTMEAENGAGIAAPQIGINKQVVIFGLDHNPRYPEAESVPMTVLINPIVTPLTDEKKAGWEGCLSVPGYRGLVERYTKIRYTGYDENGIKIDRVVDNFHAIVVQHEVDHLHGMLYVQRIKDLSNFGLIEELEAAKIIPPT